MGRDMKVEIQFDGLKDVIASLNGLKQGFRNRILRPSVKEGCDVIRDRARAKVNKSGKDKPAAKRIAKRIVSQVKTDRGTGAIEGWIISGSPQSWLLEYGHGPVKVGESQHGRKVSETAKALAIWLSSGEVIFRASTKGSAPHPFMRPAIDEGKTDAVAAIAAGIQKRMAKVQWKELTGWLTA